MQNRDWQQVLTKFKQIWGYSDFRYPQAEIIRSILARKDALIVMPTGGGKSICFQLPALLQTGLTLVVSPLVALMENQVQELQKRRLPAILLHSELDRHRRKEVLEAIAKGKLKLLYLSPETLLSPAVWEILIQPHVSINGIIIDEAHCLVQWGTNFRPAYRRLGAIRSTLLKHKPNQKIAIAAFTATADPAAQTSIIQTLQLQQPDSLLVSPYRDNLHLQVRTVWTPKGRRQQTLNFIQTKGKQSGLVYVRSRRDSEELAQWLQSLSYSVMAYHAGLATTERRIIESNWLEGKTQFVVCTSAFGMGIDKSNVRWVVHFHAPLLISEYMQEIGRSGRDGKPASALTLISEPTGWLNPEDKQRDRFFLTKIQQQIQTARQIAPQIPSRGKIEEVSKEFPNGEIALAILHSLGMVAWQDPFSYRRQSISVDLNRLFATQRHWQQQMQQYLRTKQCRWQFLLQGFGFTKEAVGFRCDRCDNCRRSS